MAAQLRLRRGQAGPAHPDADHAGRAADGGITVSGVKKPCSLTWSMNLMSASVAVADPATGTGRLAVVLISAGSAGLLGATRALAFHPPSHAAAGPSPATTPTARDPLTLHVKE